MSSNKPNNPSPLEPALDEFIWSRCDEIFRDQISSDPEYRKFSQESLQAVDSILKCLGEAERESYDDLENADGICQSICYKAIYLQGVRDGIKLKKILDLE